MNNYVYRCKLVICLKMLSAILHNQTYFYLAFSFIHLLNYVIAIGWVFFLVFSLHQITTDKLNNKINCSCNNTKEFFVKRTNNHLVLFFFCMNLKLQARKHFPTPP